MNFLRKSLILYICVNIVRSSRLRRLKIPSSADPCNPLYWYPKNIPDYCNFKTTVNPISSENSFITFPQTNNVVMSLIQAPASPVMPYMLPYPNPIVPNYSSTFQSQVGMVPGLPGIVSSDGGINIMPFSDVYADVLEEHKNKMIRRKLQKFINKYESRHRAYYPY